MKLIPAQEGKFIIDTQNGVDLPIVCVNKKELHIKIDELFPDEK